MQLELRRRINRVPKSEIGDCNAKLVEPCREVPRDVLSIAANLPHILRRGSKTAGGKSSFTRVAVPIRSNLVVRPTFKVVKFDHFRIHQVW